MSTIPLIMSSAGPVATDPATLRQNLVDAVAAQVPDYTSNLPGSLIEDIASTATGALSQVEQARVEAVNSIGPYGANAFVLSQLGIQFGLSRGSPTNTNVLVIFSGPAGYVIPAGFVVSDGTYQYVIQDAGIIASTGQTSSMLAVANQSGSWAVAPGAVTQIVTSLPSPYDTLISVTNPQAGIASTSSESVQSYRSRILQAQTIAGQGTPSYLSALLKALPGVSARLVNILQTPFGWEVICGGGDPYQVAGAIYEATLDLSTITGSQTAARNVSTTIIVPPDQYTLTYVNPPQQIVTIQAIWNTNLPSFTAGPQVNQLASTAIVNYINSIQVGQPINLLEMQNAFQSSVSTVLSSPNLTTLTFTVTINGEVVTPGAGTSIILGDAEGYFSVSASGVTVQQG